MRFEVLNPDICHGNMHCEPEFVHFRSLDAKPEVPISQQLDKIGENIQWLTRGFRGEHFREHVISAVRHQTTFQVEYDIMLFREKHLSI